MNPQLKMLVWKEWRERRTQFAVCLVWMLGASAYCVAIESTTGIRAPVARFYSASMLFSMFMPTFLAMRTSLGEIGDRTRSFSDGLPISARWRGWVRLAGGASVLVAPIVLAALVMTVSLACGWLETAPARPPQGPDYLPLAKRASLSPLAAVELLWSMAAVAVWSAMFLYLVLSLLGTKMRAESHLGYCGVVVTLLWFVAHTWRLVFDEMFPATGIGSWIGALFPESTVVMFSYGGEFGNYDDLDISHRMFGPLLVNAALQFGVAAWFVRRYSRKLTRGAVEKAEPIGRPAWWCPRLPTRGLALAWLALRQSLPICLPGLALACLITLLEFVGNGAGGYRGSFGDALPSSTWIIGALWAVVVGAASFSSEFDWRVSEFWRTRPIPAGRLFAIKFVVGLLAVLLVLDGTTIVAGWSSPAWGHYKSMSWPYIECIVPWHATMYAVAVACTCLFRRAVLGGMITLVTWMLLGIGMGLSPATNAFEPIQVYNQLGFADRPAGPAAANFPIVALAMGLIVVASILIGSLSLQRYDARRLGE